MAHSKAQSAGKTRRRSHFRTMMRPLGWRATHVLLILAAGTAAGVGLWASEVTLGLLGYGIAIADGILMLSTVMLRLKPQALGSRWNRWLALVPAGLASWGVLAFFSGSGVLRDTSLGGTFGGWIVGTPGVVGVLRVAALALLAFVLVAPSFSWSAFKQGVLALVEGWRTGLAAIARLAGKGLRALGTWLAAATPKAALWVWGLAAKAGQSMKSAFASHVPAPSLPAPAKRLLRGKPAPVAVPGVDAALPAEDTAIETGTKGKRKYAGLSESDVPLTKTTEPGGWRLPTIDVLDREPPRTLEKVDNEGKARSIEQALASYGIDASVVEINPGPAVTQFGIEPGWVRKFREIKLKDEEGKPILDASGAPTVRREEVSKTRVKVDAIANLDKDLAMALAAPSIRIEAPIPGKAMIGVEVPNNHSETVSLRSGINSIAFQKQKEKSKLAIVLGKGSGGQPEVADLAKFPHLLVAGTTGSGKSIGLRSILVALLMHATPRELRLLLIDPKRVELVAFDSVPHLISPVIVDMEKVVDALRWAISEMDERYKRFSAIGARNLEAYNKHLQVTDPFPYLVIMIDELADLMVTAPFDVEHSIVRLAQLGRATGIHLIVATQRPSVDVVTGLIKANFPTRLSFAVSSQVDSRTILDSVGAEKLLGKGDMLFLPQDAPKPKRIQGVYVSDGEVERVVRAWAQQRKDLPPSPLASVVPTRPAPMPPVPQPAPAAPTASSEHAASNCAATAVLSPSAPTGAFSISAVSVATSPMATAFPSGPAKVEKDPLMPEARLIAEQYSKVSASLLQRKLKVGYNKAVRLVELLEEEGYGEGDDDGVF